MPRGHLMSMCSATNMYLTGFVFIALYISVPVLCDGEFENRTTTIPPQPTFKTCTQAQRTRNSRTAENAAKTFKHLVKTYLKKKSIDADMLHLKLKLDNYTHAIASCAPKPRVDKLKKTINDFLELVNFTFEGNKLEEFAKHKGALHVNNTKNSIRECVISNTGLLKNRTSSYFRFIDLVNVELGQQSGCDDANTTLSCVALRLEEANGKVDETQNLAKSLFDFVAEKHCVPQVIPTAAPATISAATNISLLVIFGAVAVGSCIVTIILWKKNKSNSYAP